MNFYSNEKEEVISELGSRGAGLTSQEAAERPVTG